MMRTDSGNSVSVSADIDPTKQCTSSPVVSADTFKLSILSDKIMIVNNSSSPEETVRVVFSDVVSPELVGQTVSFARGNTGSGTTYFVATANLGEQAADTTMEIPYTFAKNGADPCIAVEVSNDGIAYYPVAASLQLQ